MSHVLCRLCEWVKVGYGEGDASDDWFAANAADAESSNQGSRGGEVVKAMISSLNH